jgi:cytochrome d ubiquinol oxidase subunit II
MLFMLHGALFLNLKTEGELQVNVQKFALRLATILIIMWAGVTNLTLIFVPVVADAVRKNPILFVNQIFSIAGLWLIVFGLIRKYEGRAFMGSLLFIATMVLNYALGTFPNLVKSSIDPAASLTISSSSSSLTMHIIVGIALAGIPLFLLYCGYTYRVFKGKVQLDSMSY